MKFLLTLFVLLVTGLGSANAAGLPAKNLALVVDTSSMPVDGGKAILTVGTLRRADGVYSGDYKIKVSPYFFKNEKGRLAIVVSDESLAAIHHGTATLVVGVATASGKGGIRRHIDVVATPDDTSHGTLKLWFMAGTRKMIFKPAYHFSENRIATTAGPKVEASLAFNW